MSTSFFVFYFGVVSKKFEQVVVVLKLNRQQCGSADSQPLGNEEMIVNSFDSLQSFYIMQQKITARRGLMIDIPVVHLEWL